MSINKYRVDSILNKYLQLQIEWKKKIDWNNSTVALFHRLYKYFACFVLGVCHKYLVRQGDLNILVYSWDQIGNLQLDATV